MNNSSDDDNLLEQVKTVKNQHRIVSGVIARRRCLGKSLSFVTLACNSENEDDDQVEGKCGSSSTTSSRMVKVAFRRAHFELFCDKNYSDMSPLPFPLKASDLPYGAHVQIHGRVLVEKATVPHDARQEEVAPAESLQVQSWYMVGDHPRTKALREAADAGGISCTQYLNARGQLFLGLQQQQQPEQHDDGIKKNRHVKARETLRGGDSQKHNREETLQNTTDDSSPHCGCADRAKIFANWLVQTMPLLQQKGDNKPVTLLLDVAGGKGQLSVELAQLSGAVCTVVDPLIRSRRSRRKLDKSRKALPQANKNDIPSFVATYFEMNRATDEMIAKYDGLVGLHPDECTEAIVDMALKHNKPFAVVPCCVFPSLFPARTMCGGKPVQSYDDFIEYLLEKDDRLKRAELAMGGKNQVIFLSSS